MNNRSNSCPGPGSYDELLKRMTRLLRQKKIDSQILELLQQAFEKELSGQRTVLSRPERVRLFQQVTRAILTDLLGKIDDAK